MKDFIRVFLLLIIVFGSIGLFVYLAYVLDYWAIAILQVVLSVGIILLFIFRFYKWFGR